MSDKLSCGIINKLNYLSQPAHIVHNFNSIITPKK